MEKAAEVGLVILDYEPGPNDLSAAFHNAGEILVATYSALFQVPAATNLSITLSLTAWATNKFGATNVLVHYTIVPPPPNDSFTNATKTADDPDLVAPVLSVGWQVEESSDVPEK